MHIIFYHLNSLAQIDMQHELKVEEHSFTTLNTNKYLITIITDANSVNVFDNRKRGSLSIIKKREIG